MIEIVYSDVCALMNTNSSDDAKHLLTSINDKSRYVFSYFLHYKKEAIKSDFELEMLKHFKRKTNRNEVKDT